MRIDFVSICFIDTRKIIGLLGDQPPEMKKRCSVKINEVREIYKRLLSHSWNKLKQFGNKNYLHSNSKDLKAEFKMIHTLNNSHIFNLNFIIR